MNEYIITPIIGLNKAESLLVIKPLDLSRWHNKYSHLAKKQTANLTGLDPTKNLCHGPTEDATDT